MKMQLNIMERCLPKPKTSVTSPSSYLNWQSHRAGKEQTNLSETKLYTDAPIIGEENLGPYHLINTIAHGSCGRIAGGKPAIVLRASYHVLLQDSKLPMNNNYRHYHGGDLTDEIAALCSLFLGIRLKAGPISREFWSGDPHGRPIEYGSKPEPCLFQPTKFRQIPSLLGERNLSKLEELRKFPELSVSDASAVVKAARLYQEAVWLADADPATAWLLLVSAVETAAQQTAVATGSSRSGVAQLMPDVVQILDQRCTEEEVETICSQFVQLTRATEKFVKFILGYAPPAPDKRPERYAQFCFDNQGNLEKAVRKIYKHRSNALHDGTAFPLPMCEPPLVEEAAEGAGSTVWEIPPGLATRARNASWTAEDTPMLLHTFEYLARGALLRWWEALPPMTSS